MEKGTTVVVHSARMHVNYVAVCFDWFSEDIEAELRRIYDRFSKKISYEVWNRTYLGFELDDINNTLNNL